MSDWLEEFWGDLLSEEPLRIAAAWATLDTEERQAIHTHLGRMANEDGWTDGQRQAARAALDVIGSDAGESGNADADSAG